MNIVIIGGGFAGVNLAKMLGDDKHFDVTLVDKNNYNFFPPLVYQVATGFLEPSSISYPFRKLFADKENVRFRLGELQKVNVEDQSVLLSNGVLKYDLLVFATGAESNYFGIENIRKNAIPMKTLDDAIELRNKFLIRMEKAIVCTNDEEKKKLLSIVVAGAGPTGVEICGMFAEMRKGILRKEYPELVGKGGDIYLVSGSDAVLAPMSKKSQEQTYKTLTEMGVKIMLGLHVSNFENDTVYLDNGETILSKNLVWAAGVKAKVFEGMPVTCYGPGKRMLVDGFNKVQGVENIYALGDTCLMKGADLKFADGHPQVAQVAIQQGINLAKNFKKMVANEPLESFSYTDKGSMAIIGKNKAVADLEAPKIHLNGFVAWLTWLFIHLFSLLTFRNKIRTFWNWTVAYLTKDQSLRMIIKPSKEIMQE